ncbi:unnamed protein product, partial [Rotaria sp. Silwood2]
MTRALRIVSSVSITNTQPTVICLPGIDHQIFSDINELKNHVIIDKNSYSFIVLLMNINDQNLRVQLEDLKRQHHVLAIFICVKPRSTLRFDGNNVFPVVKELMAYKIKSSVVQFFEDTSKKLLALNQIASAYLFREKANFFKRQRFTNGKIETDDTIR